MPWPPTRQAQDANVPCMPVACALTLANYFLTTSGKGPLAGCGTEGCVPFPCDLTLCMCRHGRQGRLGACQGHTAYVRKPACPAGISPPAATPSGEGGSQVRIPAELHTALEHQDLGLLIVCCAH